MTKCDVCGKTILLGGKTVGNARVCSDKCATKSPLIVRASTLTPEEIAPELAALHASNCPKCGGSGPIDIHTAHTIWSAVYLTSYKSKPHLCCKKCGRKEQLKAMAMATVLGWWGFPWGIVFTPIQIGKNIAGIAGGPKPDTPSPALEQIVRTQIAARRLAEEAGAPPIPSGTIQAVPIAAQNISTPPIPAVPTRRASTPAKTSQNGSPFSDSNPFG